MNIMSNTDFALSKTEKKILCLMAKDYSNKEIAEKLFLSVSTVKWYISALYEKMEVRGRVQAAILAYKKGFIE